MANLWYILLAIVMFGALVFLHELGHFAAARWTGVGVKEFAMGFGPKIFSFVGKKSGTRYSLRILPFGGFCGFYGENAEDEEEGKRPDGFQKAKVWKRALISVCGPLMNIAAAIILLFALYAGVGLLGVSTTIGEVTAGMPAEEAGFWAGDRIVSVSGVEIQSAAEASRLILEAGENPIDFVLERNGEQIALNVTPRFSQADGRNMIGIVYQTVPVRFGIWPSLRYAAQDTWNMSGAILNLLREMIFTGEGVDELTGPIGTVAIISEETQSGGIRAYLSLAAMISVNLGLFNLLPIPGLDGSKLIFLALEKLRGKPVSPEKEGMVTLIGFGFLVLLMIFVMYKDIVRLFT